MQLHWNISQCIRNRDLNCPCSPVIRSLSCWTIILYSQVIPLQGPFLAVALLNVNMGSQDRAHCSCSIVCNYECAYVFGFSLSCDLTQSTPIANDVLRHLFSLPNNFFKRTKGGKMWWKMFLPEMDCGVVCNVNVWTELCGVDWIECGVYSVLAVLIAVLNCTTQLSTGVLKAKYVFHNV